MPLFPCIKGLGIILPLRIRCRIRARLGIKDTENQTTKVCTTCTGTKYRYTT